MLYLSLWGVVWGFPTPLPHGGEWAPYWGGSHSPRHWKDWIGLTFYRPTNNELHCGSLITRGAESIPMSTLIFWMYRFLDLLMSTVCSKVHFVDICVIVRRIKKHALKWFSKICIHLYNMDFEKKKIHMCKYLQFF